MSVIIKGMGMPTGNDELRLIIRSNGQVIISHKTYYEETEAVPVPPHGDLIDRDELIKFSHYDDHDICVVDMEDIRNAPTIIEAEPPKEG